MKYEFFSSARDPAEVVCAFPIVRRMMAALDIRRATLNLDLYDNATVVKMAKRYRGLRLCPPHPDFMRLSRVYEPTVVIQNTLHINIWHRQARGAFGDLTLQTIADVCNHHLSLLELPVENNLRKFLPHLPNNTLTSSHRPPRHDSSYPTLFVTPGAFCLLEKQVQWSRLFSSCSLGFFAMPDSANFKPACVWSYTTKELNKVMLGELAQQFEIVIATAGETVMFDINSGPEIVYIVDDGVLYYANTTQYCRKVFSWEDGHDFLIKKLRGARK